MTAKLRKLVLLASFAVFWTASWVHAYVLSGPHLLDLMVNGMEAPKTMLVLQRRIVHPELETDMPAEIEEILRYRIPEHFRSDSTSDQAEKTHIFAVDHSVTVVDNRIQSMTESGLEFYKDPLLFRDRLLLENRLQLLGVDTGISSLGRFNGRIAYVIGAQYPDESTPQIWLDQKTFRPFRFLVPDSFEEGFAPLLEIHYLNWQKSGRIWYPMLIEIRQEGLLIQTIRVESIEINPRFGEDLFDIESLLESLAPEKPLSDEKKRPDDLSDVQQSIDNFKKLYE